MSDGSMHQPIDDVDEMIEEMASRDGFYPTTQTVINELAALRKDNASLREALARAILDTSRVSVRCVDYDPAGSTYEVQWLSTVQRWADLCELQLEEHDPDYYAR